MEIRAMTDDVLELPLWEDIDDPKRVSILEAALEVFSKNGYSAATTRAIATEAGVSNGLLFYYFKDKRNLFTMLTKHLRGVIIKYLHDEISSGIYEDLMRLMRRKLIFSANYPDIYSLFAEQIRLFPEEYARYGREMRLIYPLIQCESGDLSHEILLASLDGLAAGLIQRFQSGSITKDALIEQGINKANEYINFFVRLEKEDQPACVEE